MALWALWISDKQMHLCSRVFLLFNNESFLLNPLSDFVHRIPLCHAYRKTSSRFKRTVAVEIQFNSKKLRCSPYQEYAYLHATALLSVLKLLVQKSKESNLLSVIDISKTNRMLGELNTSRFLVTSKPRRQTNHEAAS